MLLSDDIKYTKESLMGKDSQMLFYLDFLVSYRYKGLNLLKVKWKWREWKSNKAELSTTDTG